MIYCPECGHELNENTKFCLYCGAKLAGRDELGSQNAPTVEREPEQNRQSIQHAHQETNHTTHYRRAEQDHAYKKKEHAPKNRNFGGLSLFLVLLLVGAGAFGILTVTTWGELTGIEEFEYTGSDPALIQAINLDLSTQDLNINYNNTDMPEYMKLSYQWNLRGTMLKDKNIEDLFIWEWNNETSTKDLTIERKEYRSWLTLDHSKVDLTLRTDLTYNITGYSGVGSIDYSAPDNTVVKRISLSTGVGRISFNVGQNYHALGDTILNTGTGKIDMSIGAGSEFSGKFSAIASTGDVNLDANGVKFYSIMRISSSTGKIETSIINSQVSSAFYVSASTGDIRLGLLDNTYSSDGTWYINTSTGKIDLTLQQNILAGGNITGYLETSTGDIEVKYIGQDSIIGAKVDLVDMDSGDIGTVYTTGFSVTEPYISDGFASAVNTYEFQIRTDLGDFEANLLSQ